MIDSNNNNVATPNSSKGRSNNLIPAQSRITTFQSGLRQKPKDKKSNISSDRNKEQTSSPTRITLGSRGANEKQLKINKKVSELTKEVSIKKHLMKKEEETEILDKKSNILSDKNKEKTLLSPTKITLESRAANSKQLKINEKVVKLTKEVQAETTAIEKYLKQRQEEMAKLDEKIKAYDKQLKLLYDDDSIIEPSTKSFKSSDSVPGLSQFTKPRSQKSKMSLPN